ncbi:MAG: PEP-CTERM sorting domain-containing protein [Pseudomonadales bacterium]|jgi:hypothetical protein|nr:PEP-CTERM sorting domain-containing protein [Pseudomonadales bacterium]
MMHRRFPQVALVLATTLLAAPGAQAAVLTLWSDKAAFQALGVASLTGAIPNSGNVGATETLGDVTLSTTPFPTSTSLFLGTGGLGFDQWSTKIAGNDIAVSGSENLEVTIDLAEGVNAFGFDFHEPSTTGLATDGTNTPFFHDSVFTITLFEGAIEIASTTFDPEDDVLLFFGLTSTASFDRVQITESLAGDTYTVGGRSVDKSNDNEFFGEFYAGTVSVPEPTTTFLLGLGALLLGGRRARAARRR